MPGAVKSIAVGLILHAVSVLPATAQSTLLGMVTSDSLGSPMAGVEVLVQGSGRSAVTGELGSFRIDGLPAGTWEVLFRKVGFQPLRRRVQLWSADSTRVVVQLTGEVAQVLEPVQVEGHLSVGRGLGREAFEERRARGFGVFLDSTELGRNTHRRLSDLFRGLQGVKVVRYQECDGSPRRCGPIEQRAGSARGATSMIPRSKDDAHCWMSVILDGQLLYQSGSLMKVPDLSRDFTLSELEMVEVYRSAGETPGEYSGSGAACGVVLLWSRRGT